MPDLTIAPELMLRYECDVGALDPALRACFVPLNHDEVAERFVRDSLAHPHGRLRTGLYRVLRRGLSDYDAYGLLGMYPMHLLSTEQLRELLGARTDAPRALLDCGAGRGDVTACAAPLFQDVVTSEASAVMRARLRRHGYTVVDHALSSLAHESRRFDAILWLNVLDRCSHPRTLLRQLRGLLAPHGKLVVAVPLPLAPHVQHGGATVDPEELLPDAAPTWEQGASRVATVLHEAGLHIERLSRAPYMTRGDAHTPLHVLDDAVFVCGPST
jgi:SAM-dependent methyltransferase